MLNSPYKIYQQSSVQTASSGQLLLMLYEGAIRFTKSGMEGIKSRNYEAANTNLIKAQAIVNELIAALNHDYDIAKDLLRIYEYLLHLLIQANVKKDETMAAEAVKHLSELRDAWKQAVKQTAGGLMKEAGSI
ncbi:flagellar protein FliS [Paenibacillus cellulosilyticus]|uniref:Flagellar secretion chaperone FliS n=1 Tax=Paenibacillus cellulosilyticus TaxID=375489 RepID=A0A2V2Z8C7_9BACL|nr:flagellar export chaperone FliS [Paenibacillus cellulosilyticus]PWW08351.1 flagellar protein FliS [Paenibacillus cellulosilyticus]QKS47949.1 flagellar export chaperone FliS [Paenibacillus cellulosilyticus]